jgi:diamine N-acetyltransferase
MIKGQKTYLRAAELEDTRLISAWLNDREANRYLDIIYPMSKRDGDNFLLEADNDYSKKILLIDNEDHKTIGLIYLKNIKWEYRNCEIGIVIYDKNSRGMGYGKDALETALRFVFEDMNMHLIYLHVAQGNINAIELYKKLGFIAEGILRDRYYKNNSYQNLIIMSKINPSENTSS